MSDRPEPRTNRVEPTVWREALVKLLDTRGPVYKPHENRSQSAEFAETVARVIGDKLEELSKTKAENLCDPVVLEHSRKDFAGYDLAFAFVGAPPKFEAERASLQDAILASTPTYVKQLIAGGVSGGLSKTAVAPLERVKILYQLKHGNFQSIGVSRSLSSIAKTEGLCGLYRGNGASVLRIVPYAGLQYAAYEKYRNWIIEGVPAAGTGPVVELVAGSSAGGTAVLCTYPLDLARNRLAYQVSAPKYLCSSCGSVLPAPYTEGGVRGLYRGVCPTIWGTMHYASLQFIVYVTLKGYLPEDSRNSITAKTACGVTAGVVGQTLTYPLDVVSRQMQVQSENALVGAQYKGTLDGLISIARGQGWKQLFAGLGVNYMKVVPSAAIGFTAYDSLKSTLQMPPRGS